MTNLLYTDDLSLQELRDDIIENQLSLISMHNIWLDYMIFMPLDIWVAYMPFHIQCSLGLYEQECP